MKQTSFTTIILTAGRGKYLTQASQDVDIKDRVIGKKVALGANDSPDNWCEISEADKEEFERQRTEAMEADRIEKGEYI